MTLLPASRYCFASLPIVVVLPLPLTPTTRITNGRFAGSMRSGFCTGSTSRMTSSASAARTSSGATSWLKRVRRSSSTTSPATPIPMSLAISSSSSSASARSSRRRRRKIVLMPSLSRAELRDSPGAQPAEPAAAARSEGVSYARGLRAPEREWRRPVRRSRISDASAVRDFRCLRAGSRRDRGRCPAWFRPATPRRQNLIRPALRSDVSPVGRDEAHPRGPMPGSSAPSKRDRGIAIGAAAAGALDQHVAFAADARRQAPRNAAAPAARSRAARSLHQRRDRAAACARPACRAAGCRERRGERRCRIPRRCRGCGGTSPRSRSGSRRSDRRRARCRGASSRARARRGDRLGAAVPPLHALQDQIVARLQRQMQMRHQPAARRRAAPTDRRRSRSDRARTGADAAAREPRRAAAAPSGRGSACPADRRRRRSGRRRSARSRDSRQRRARAPVGDDFVERHRAAGPRA